MGCAIWSLPYEQPGIVTTCLQTLGVSSRCVSVWWRNMGHSGERVVRSWADGEWEKLWFSRVVPPTLCSLVFWEMFNKWKPQNKVPLVKCSETAGSSRGCVMVRLLRIFKTKYIVISWGKYYVYGVFQISLAIDFLRNQTIFPNCLQCQYPIEDSWGSDDREICIPSLAPFNHECFELNSGLHLSDWNVCFLMSVKLGVEEGLFLHIIFKVP